MIFTAGLRLIFRALGGFSRECRHLEPARHLDFL